MSTITATTTTTTVTGDTSGTLVFAVGSGPTTALTLGTNQTATFGTGVSVAGTSTVNTFTTGTLKTSPSAGDIEFDGYSFYATPTTGQRGTIPTNAQYLGATVTGPSTTTDVKMTNGTNGGVFIQANVVYLCEISMYASYSGSIGTAHTMLFRPDIGGSVTFSVFSMQGFNNTSATTTTTATGVSTAYRGASVLNTLSSNFCRAISVSAIHSIGLYTRGIIKTSASGYLVFGYSSSLNVTTAYVTNAVTFINVTPIGFTSSNTLSIGSWA